MWPDANSGYLTTPVEYYSLMLTQCLKKTPALADPLFNAQDTANPTPQNHPEKETLSCATAEASPAGPAYSQTQLCGEAQNC